MFSPDPNLSLAERLQVTLMRTLQLSTFSSCLFCCHRWPSHLLTHYSSSPASFFLLSCLVPPPLLPLSSSSPASFLLLSCLVLSPLPPRSSFSPDCSVNTYFPEIRPFCFWSLTMRIFAAPPIGVLLMAIHVVVHLNREWCHVYANHPEIEKKDWR